MVLCGMEWEQHSLIADTSALLMEWNIGKFIVAVVFTEREKFSVIRFSLAASLLKRKASLEALQYVMSREMDAACIYFQNNFALFLVGIRLVTNPIGIFLLCTMEFYRNKFVAHKSLKLLMACHAFWILVYNVETLIDSVLYAVAYSTAKDPADILLTTSQCLYRKFPDALALYGSVSSMLAMAMERRAASLTFATYERTGGRGWMYAMAHLAIVIIFGAIMWGTYQYPTLTPHCAVVTPGGLVELKIVNTFLLLMEFATIVVFSRLLRRNQRILKASKFDMGLTEKYQLSENIRMLKLFLPVVGTHTTLTVAGLILFFAFHFTEFGPDYYPMFEDTINFIYLQGIFMPLIFLYRYRQQRQHENHLYSSNRPTDDTFESRYKSAIQQGW